MIEHYREQLSGMSMGKDKSLLLVHKLFADAKIVHPDIGSERHKQLISALLIHSTASCFEAIKRVKDIVQSNYDYTIKVPKTPLDYFAESENSLWLRLTDENLNKFSLNEKEFARMKTDPLATQDDVDLFLVRSVSFAYQLAPEVFENSYMNSLSREVSLPHYNN